MSERDRKEKREKVTGWVIGWVRETETETERGKKREGKRKEYREREEVIFAERWKKRESE